MIATADEDPLPSFAKEIDQRWRTRQRALPNVVYHYTPATSLRSILESQRIWATIASEAHKNELSYAVSRWKTMINRHATAATLPEYRHLYPPQTLTIDYLHASKATFFVACFSGHPDDQRQWENYADHSTGLAIGFDSGELQRLDRTEVSQDIGFFGVQYQEAEQDEFFDWLLSRWEREAAPALAHKRLKSTNPRMYLARWLGGPLATSALSLFPRMKDRSFDIEDEWRVAHMHVGGAEPCCEIRSGNDFKTHVDLDLGQLAGRLPIVSVCLGPTIANDASEERVQRLLRGYGYEFRVDRSLFHPVTQQIIDLESSRPTLHSS